MSVSQTYFERTRAQIAALERRSLDAIGRAAEVCAECLLRCGVSGKRLFGVVGFVIDVDELRRVRSMIEERGKALIQRLTDDA